MSGLHLFIRKSMFMQHVIGWLRINKQLPIKVLSLYLSLTICHTNVTQTSKMQVGRPRSHSTLGHGATRVAAQVARQLIRSMSKSSSKGRTESSSYSAPEKVGNTRDTVLSLFSATPKNILGSVPAAALLVELVLESKEKDVLPVLCVLLSISLWVLTSFLKPM